MNLFRNKLKRDLQELVEMARILKLSENDLNHAKEFLEENEFGLCFDQIIIQIYEFDIGITKEFYDLVSKIGKRMELPEDDYSYLKELIRN